MAAVEEELEEGEITDSEEEEQKCTEMKETPARHYSIFDNQPRTAPVMRNNPIPRSDSDDSDDNNDYCSNDDDDDDDITKKKKCPGSNKTDSNHSKPFVNPNFVNNGGSMPPMPEPPTKKRAIWSSILQEQILTAEVGSFSMEKKLPLDRDVESYDYSRAKDDDRPDPAEDEMINEAFTAAVEEELFGEVIDLEKVALNQRRNLKRKHPVTQRLGMRTSVKDRLALPRPTEESPPEDVTYFIGHQLQESKIHLIRRIVKVVGRSKALDLFKETEKVEASGGMMINNGSRRRTPGGVYLTLLKADGSVTKEQQDKIFEEENKWWHDMRTRKKARARRRRKEQKGQQKREPASSAENHGESQADHKTPSMEVAEDANSRSSVEGQTGSPRNSADHWSDTQEGLDPKFKDSQSESESEEEQNAAQDFDNQLAHELHRQAAGKGTKEVSAGDGDADVITLDDVLDLEVDDDFID